MCVVWDEPRTAGERCLFPQPKSAAKGIGVIACATTRRQRFELLDVASPEHRVVGLQSRNQASHDVGNVTPPFLLAVALQSCPADIVLIGALLVGQVTEFHGFHDAVDNDGRSKPGSEAQKEHLAALVAPQCLHGGVVDDLHRAAECCGKIESDPPASQVVRVRDRPAVENRAGIADRHHLTSAAIRLGASVGPDENDRLSLSPVARILTELPPTSTASTVLTEDFIATSSCRSVPFSKASSDLACT